MASVYKKRQKWWMRFKDADGRWRDRPTHARNKTEARRLAEATERQYERTRAGLGPSARPDLRVGDMMKWWLDNQSIHTASHSRDTSAVRKHLIETKLATIPVAELKATAIESHLQSLQSALAPQTLNHIRGYLHRAFEAAARVGLWTGDNPAAGVKRRRVPQRVPNFLNPEEVGAVMKALDSKWRPLFATAFYTGMRKGELCGLLKSDVDLANGFIHVRRSYDRATTKGGHADTLPIHDDLGAFLATAIELSPSRFVFPAGDGRMRKPGNFRPEEVLRRAMARAGIVEGWMHVCRRKACGYSLDAADGELRLCERCGMKLWPKAQVRAIRFHDCRHTAASLTLMAGGDVQAVQRLMRHRDPRLTIQTYGHLTGEYLRGEMNKLQLGLTQAAETESARLAAHLLPPSSDPASSAAPKAGDRAATAPSRQYARQDSNLSDRLRKSSTMTGFWLAGG